MRKRTRALRWALAMCVAIGLQACSGDSPISPSGQTPSVAGTYAGPLDLASNGSTLATFSTRMTVTQSGSQLTISGTIAFDGQGAQLPPITGSIDQSGLFTATDGGAAAVMTDTTCGLVATTSATLNFSGRTARYVEQVTTTLCGNWTLSGTLTR